METKERPILFSAPMVRALLEGRKTVTRRTLSARAIRDIGYGAQLGECYDLPAAGPIDDNSMSYIADFCPYGQPGDRLWVRESLRYDCEYGHYFAAGGRHGETVYLCSLFDNEETQTGPSYDGLLPERSVPSIHLHRRYSRILLEITDVRVERLQDISRAEIRAEGLECPPGLASDDVSPNYRDWYPAAWRELWNSIKGTGAWEANPWVWCVSFKRVTQ